MIFRHPWQYAARLRRLTGRPQGKTPTNVTPVYPSYVPHFEKTKNNTNRRIQPVVLSTYPIPTSNPKGQGQLDKPEVRVIRSRRAQRVLFTPVAPLQSSAATLPAYQLKTVEKRTGWRKALSVQVPPNIQLTDVSEADIPLIQRVNKRVGYRKNFIVDLVPGIGPRTLTTEPAAIKLLKPHKVSFNRALQRLPELDFRPVQAPSASIVLPAARVNRRKGPKPDFEIVQLIFSNKSAPTPSAFLISPFKAIIRHTPRRFLKPLDVIGVDSQAGSTWSTGRPVDFEVNKLPSRRLQRVAPVAEYLREKSPVGSLFRTPFVRTRATERRFLDVLRVNEYPATPKGSEGYPSQYRPLEVFRRSSPRIERELLTSIYSGYPTPVDELVAFATGFDVGPDYHLGLIAGEAYTMGDMSDVVYIVTQPYKTLIYVNGVLVDTIYTKGDL